MARPQKLGIDYFSLDVDFDASLEVILSQLGEKGLGIAVRIWQYIYKTKGYYIPYNEDELYMIKRNCNDSSKEEIEKLIKKMVDKNLFNKKIFNEKAILTSARLQKNYLIASRNRVSNEINKEYLIVSSVSNSSDSTQRKGKERIVKYSKVKKIKFVEVYFDNNSLNEIFIDFLKLRLKLKAVNTDRAILGLIKKLEPFDNNMKILMINESIISSWKSVFELKKDRLINYYNNKNLLPKDIESDWLDNYIRNL